MSICPEVLTNPKSVSNGLSFKEIDSKMDQISNKACTDKNGSNVGSHAVTVVGMKNKGDETMYLIQDSKGPNCNDVPDAYQCVEESGQLWIPESSLVRNTGHIYTFGE